MMKAELKFKHQHRDVTLEMIDANQVHEMMIEQTFYEHWLLSYIQKTFNGGVLIDVGAHTGNHAVFFSMFCNFELIIAYEPNAEAFDILEKNIQRNFDVDHDKRVYSINAALGDLTGEYTMKIHDQSRSGSAMVIPAEKKETNLIQMLTLDDEVEKFERKISVIKVDVEGYEMEVLRGAEKTIAKHKPDLFIETHFNPFGIEQQLKHLGYELKERYCHAPVYHYSTNDRIPKTYKQPKDL